MTSPRGDDGFVLVDALLASALLALAGTTVLVIVLTALDRQRQELDRSVALVAMQSIVREIQLVARPAYSPVERRDELFAYSAAPTGRPVIGTQTLIEWLVTATPVSGGESVAIGFLVKTGEQ